MKLIVLAVVACAMIQNVIGDIYLHNPRGSNNRLNTNSPNVRDPRRLFDSQNNNKGGYNLGDAYETHPHSSRGERHAMMRYFMSGIPRRNNGKSYLDIEWTNQHGCAGLDQNCDIILQYMCQAADDKEVEEMDVKRNGIYDQRTYYTPPHARFSKDQRKTRAKNDLRKSLHEPWEWYDKCYTRTRNKGLFTADQNLKGETSVYTRQNPNGGLHNRFGFECPEERDYYPYHFPTDWIDIAVLTTAHANCKKIQSESFNVKKKGECLESYGNGWKHASKYTTPSECQAGGGTWKEFSNYLEILPQLKSKTACLRYMRIFRRQGLQLIWAIPYRSENIDKLPQSNMEACLIKLPAPECKQAPYSRPNHLGNGANVTPLHYQWTLPYFPSQNDQRCIFRIRYNISTADPQEDIKTDPTVTLLGGLPLQLAINTAQMGRTFQDRSHVFLLLARSKHGLSDKPDIQNVNVRGKRGNIVETFPAVEYDYIPKRLNITYGDLVHMSWTGTNSQSGAGEGRRGTDRHNFVQMTHPSLSIPMDGSDVNDMFNQNATVYWPKSESYNLEAAMTADKYCPGARTSTRPNVKLDNSCPYNVGAVIGFKPGNYYYMCTRNNNFSNRSQKGRLFVSSKKRRGR